MSDSSSRIYTHSSVILMARDWFATFSVITSKFSFDLLSYVHIQVELISLLYTLYLSKVVLDALAHLKDMLSIPSCLLWIMDNNLYNLIFTKELGLPKKLSQSQNCLSRRWILYGQRFHKRRMWKPPNCCEYWKNAIPYA